jgi:hypothetical protein
VEEHIHSEALAPEGIGAFVRPDASVAGTAEEPATGPAGERGARCRNVPGTGRAQTRVR